MNKADRKRRQARDRKRSHRARMAEAARAEKELAEAQKWLRENPPSPPTKPQQPRTCKTCGDDASFSLPGGNYCAKHGKEIALRPGDTPPPAQPAWLQPPAPPAEPGPVLFDPAADRFRPLWWDVVDPKPAPIEISLSPRTVARSLRPRPVRVDQGIVFTEEGGHIDIAAEQAQLEEQRKDTGR